MMGDSSQDYIAFTIPTPWEVLETFAGIAGFTVELSDKGSIAQKLIQLVGGIGKLWVLSGRTVYDLWDQLAELRQAKEFKARLRDALERRSGERAGDIGEHIIQAIASDRHERALQTFGQMKNTLKFRQNTSKAFVDWLIRNRLVFRGIETVCPICGTAQWLYIDDLESEMQCVGCQQSVDTPLDADVTQWRYRANALYAKAHELGIIPHLLTLSYAIEQASAQSSEIRGVFPGITLRARDGVKVSLLTMEIDVAWLENGDLVIGECKTNGRELSHKEVARYLQIAELLRCKRIVFSALDDFGNLAPEVQQVLDSTSVHVNLLTRKDLFDQYPGKGSQDKFAGESTTPHEAFQESLGRFLEWTRRGL
jgi:hypothetical protein